jgi:hypothetical protein
MSDGGGLHGQHARDNESRSSGVSTAPAVTAVVRALRIQRCRLYNPDDAAAALGTGPRYLLGDNSADVVTPRQ